MEEIKVGEYGRTNLGNIIKFAWFYNKETNERDKNKVVLIDLMKTETRPFYYFKKEEQIVKHSPNIIDLIEEGDYVNGYKIIKILIDPFINEKQLFTNQYESNWQGDKALITFHETDIKTILTKEMYTANCYEVK